jgi:hypothetical protein
MKKGREQKIDEEEIRLPRSDYLFGDLSKPISDERWRVAFPQIQVASNILYSSARKRRTVIEYIRDLIDIDISRHGGAI